MTDTRPFPLVDILGVIAGHPVAPSTTERVLCLMQWMTGTPLMVRDHILSARVLDAGRACRSALLVRNSDLIGAGVPDLADEQAVAAWVLEMREQFGDTRDIARLAVPEQRAA